MTSYVALKAIEELDRMLELHPNDNDKYAPGFRCAWGWFEASLNKKDKVIANELWQAHQNRK